MLPSEGRRPTVIYHSEVIVSNNATPSNPKQLRANPELELPEVNSGLNLEQSLGFNLTQDYGVYQVLDPYKSRM